MYLNFASADGVRDDLLSQVSLEAIERGKFCIGCQRLSGLIAGSFEK